MEGKKFENLEKRMCKELMELEDKYGAGAEMSNNDIQRIDTLAHALKSLATYQAMKEAEDYEAEGFSGRRGRSPVTGRYVSRDGGASYSDGYAQGYSEAMSQMQGNSGHYPMPPWHPNKGVW